MIKSQISELLSHVNNNLTPAAGEVDHLPHPCSKHRCLELAMVIEHRFAFFYWVRWCEKLINKNNTLPELISIDWHDDVGVPNDYPSEHLSKYNFESDSELALFCWAEMPSLNDSNIWLPIHLGYFQAAHIILKHEQHLHEYPDGKYTVTTKGGEDRNIFFYSSPDEFLDKKYCHSDSIILDIDLDYFTDARICEHSTLFVDEIEQIFSAGSQFRNKLLPYIQAISIALEPRFCGGFVNSLSLFKKWYSTLFDSQVNNPPETK